MNRATRATPPTTPELEVARAAATEAGACLAGLFGRPVAATRNGLHDVKAEADETAEQLILGRLRATFPADDIIAEESGASDAAERGAGGRTWLVDPLDGTVNFASAIPFFAVSLALIVDGRPVLGVVHDPVRGETHLALAGAGAWRVAAAGGRYVDPPEAAANRARRLRIRSLARLGDAVVAIDPGDPGEALAVDTAGLARLRRRIRVSRTLGSAALSLAWVGAGRLDGFIRPAGIQPLDVIAGALVASEAGATVGDPHGGPWPDLARHGALLGIVAAHPRLHRAVLRALG